MTKTLGIPAGNTVCCGHFKGFQEDLKYFIMVSNLCVLHSLKEYNIPEFGGDLNLGLASILGCDTLTALLDTYILLVCESILMYYYNLQCTLCTVSLHEYVLKSVIEYTIYSRHFASVGRSL